MKNAIGDVVDLEEVNNGFKGKKTRNIARLLFKERAEIEYYLTNFSGKGFNEFDDILTYRSYRISEENTPFEHFEMDFLTLGLCDAVSNCFYQSFETEEKITVNSLFAESSLKIANIFNGIKNNSDLSLYKFIL